MGYAVLLALFCVVSLNSCSILKKNRCNRNHAIEKGKHDAQNGDLSRPGRDDGKGCDEDYTTTQYDKDYFYGFETQRKEMCTYTRAKSLAHDDGSSGRVEKPSLSQLRVCTELKGFSKLENAYHKEFIKSYCTDKRASALGQSHASEFDDLDMGNNFELCPSSRQKALFGIYKKAYYEGLKKNCTVTAAFTRGAEDAQTDRKTEDQFFKYRKCPGSRQAELISSYQRSYNEQKEKIRLQRELEEMKRKAAEEEALRKQREQQLQQQQAQQSQSEKESSFYFNNRKYYATCRVSNVYTEVRVQNPYRDSVRLKGNWQIRNYDGNGSYIGSEREYKSMWIVSNSSDVFTKYASSPNVRSCRAEFMGE